MRNSYICYLLNENCHPHFTFFINIQIWKSISASITSNSHLLYIFGTFSEQQISDILHQIHLESPFEQFYEIKRQLSLRDKVIIKWNNEDIK
jgi:hypothetical protein